MKTLKKNNEKEFKRVKDSSPSDIKQINELLDSGWSYCPKSEWKATRVKKEEKTPEKKGGDKKRGKNS